MKLTSVDDPVSWDTFADKFFDLEWFDYKGRPKTANAVRYFHKKVPAHVLNTLLEIPEKIIVFAPTPAKNGQVVPMRFLKNAENQNAGIVVVNAVLIYLSPELERRPQKYVNTSVAHEFA